MNQSPLMVSTYIRGMHCTTGSVRIWYLAHTGTRRLFAVYFVPENEPTKQYIFNPEYCPNNDDDEQYTTWSNGQITFEIAPIILK